MIVVITDKAFASINFVVWNSLCGRFERLFNWNLSYFLANRIVINIKMSWTLSSRVFFRVDKKTFQPISSSNEIKEVHWYQPKYDNDKADNGSLADRQPSFFKLTNPFRMKVSSLPRWMNLIQVLNGIHDLQEVNIDCKTVIHIKLLKRSIINPNGCSI